MKLAATIEQQFGTVNPPPPVAAIGSGGAGLSRFLSNIVLLIYTVSIVVFVFMIVIGAFQWITSGGDKDKLANAKKRITHAIIGVVILGLAFVIITAIGKITGFTFFTGQR